MNRQPIKHAAGGLPVLFLAAALFAGSGTGLFAQSEKGLSFSGVLDTRLLMAAGAGEGPDFSMGLESAANLRAQAPLREWGTFYGAVNFIAATGTPALALTSLGQSGAPVFLGGENYAGAIELERLYFRVKGEVLQLDAGLMRLPFGYGNLWGPSDFLNPRSPLLPDARLRGVLGAAFAAYPAGDLKLLSFATAPKDPLNAEGEGVILGLGGERHWGKASVQGLYAYETPQGQSSQGVHRAGFSVKADAEVGLVADMLYTGDPVKGTGAGGLSASAGLDYTFLDGYLYVLAEYLYSGAASSTAGSLGLTQRHYLNIMGQYSIDDYTKASLVFVAGLEDASFSPILSAEYEPLQGMVLTLSAQVPLDRDLFSGDGNHGELGPERTQTRALVTLKARVRF
ncbi:MAG: hypothetical protein LBD37_00435 [Treponema sp.]|jgi:hypothetical protein|nr:hypothetical protein [Treponema sp.]